MEISKITTLKYQNEEYIDFEISIILFYNSSIKFKVKNIDDFSVYEKILSFKEIIEYRPFMIIDEINEIYEVIIDGIKSEQSFRIMRAENNNIVLIFNTFFAKKYTNSFELEMVINESVSTDFLILEILKKLKKLKAENTEIRKENEILKKDNIEFKKINEVFNREIIFLREKVNNLSVYDINIDEFLNFENYNFLCYKKFKKRFKFDVIYSQIGTMLNKDDLRTFRNKIKFKKNLFYVINLKYKQTKILLGFFQSIALDKDLNSENYFNDEKSFIIEFDNKIIFDANNEKGKQLRTCNGYYLLFGNDGNFNGFYIREDTSSLPNIYEKTNFFKMDGTSKAGFEFNNRDIICLNVYMLDFN